MKLLVDNNYDFQVSERLHRGPEFARNYLIDYLIITPLSHNHRKANCYWGYNKIMILKLGPQK